MSTTFTSKINGNDIYAKRAERTRSGVNLETFTTTGEGAKTTYGILPAGITTPTVADDEANTLATQKYVKDAFSGADALVYKGALAGGDTGDYGALTPAATKGDVYKVSAVGKIDGVAVEVGDMLICNSDDTAAATAENYSTIAGKWDVIQVNIDGAVVGPASAVDGNIALFDGASGKLIKNGANLALSNSPASKAIVTNAQGAIVDEDLTTADPTVPSSGTTTATAFIDSVSQDSQGKITASKKNLPEASTETKGIVQLAGSIGATVASENNKAATEKAVRDAINDLDVAAIAGATNKTITSISETDGKIAATFQDISIASSQISDKMSTYDGTGTDKDKVITGEGVKAAIDTLDVTDRVGDVSGSMKGKTLLTLTETDGKINATFQDIGITSSQVTDKQTTTFDGTAETLTTGKAVKSAIDALDATVTNSDKGVSITVVQTDGVLTSASVSAGLAGSTFATAGLMYYETEDLPD